MPGPDDVPEFLRRLLDGAGGVEVVEIGGGGNGPSLSNEEKIARLERMFKGDDGDARAVQAFIRSLREWEKFMQTQQEGQGKKVSQGIVDAIDPFIKGRVLAVSELEKLGSVREVGRADALGSPMPEEYTK